MFGALTTVTCNENPRANSEHGRHGHRDGVPLLSARQAGGASRMSGVEEDAHQALERSMLGKLSPADLRQVLPAYLSGFVAHPEASAQNRRRMEAVVGTLTDDDAGVLLGHLRTLGAGDRLCLANPHGRMIAREWIRDVVVSPIIDGISHLQEATQRGPVLLLCNHLSYVDATATDAVLAWSGHELLANKVVAVAGPKVYQGLFRLVAAAGINSLPVPQSTSFVHTEQLSLRDLARRAVASLRAASSVMNQGYLLLLYPEGSRSRTGRLRPFLRGTHRYLGCADGIQIVPTAISGTQSVMGVGDPKLTPGAISVSFGTALHVGKDGTPRDLLVESHARVAALLPEPLRPLPGDQPTV